MLRSRFVRCVACSMLLLAIAGCGGSSGPSGTVSGNATLKGQPLKAGTILTFSGDKGVIASGVVDANGAYVLKIIGAPSPDSIPLGSYKIAVTAPAAGEQMSEADYEAMMNSGGKPPQAKKDTSIPAKYTSAQTSGLVCEVKTGANKHDVALD